jgi:hypothetical protein
MNCEFAAISAPKLGYGSQRKFRLGSRRLRVDVELLTLRFAQRPQMRPRCVHDPVLEQVRLHVKEETHGTSRIEAFCVDDVCRNLDSNIGHRQNFVEQRGSHRHRINEQIISHSCGRATDKRLFGRKEAIGYRKEPARNYGDTEEIN